MLARRRGRLGLGPVVAELIEHGEEALQRERHDHDQPGGDENGVAHARCHAALHVAGPGQRVVAGELQDAVERDGHAGRDAKGDQPLELRPRAHVGDDHQPEQNVRALAEQALLPLIGAEEAGQRDDRDEWGAGEDVNGGVNDDGQHHRHAQRGGEAAPQAGRCLLRRFGDGPSAHRTGARLAAVPVLLRQLDQPGNSHHHDDIAQIADLVRLKYAAAVDVEIKRREHRRGQPATFNNLVTDKRQTIGQRELLTLGRLPSPVRWNRRARRGRSKARVVSDIVL